MCIRDRSEDNGDRRPPLRGDNGGARRVEADFGPVELSCPPSRMYPRRSSMDSRVYRRIGALALPLAVLLAGCDLSLGHLAARATDEWTHTYPLSPGGEVRIVNTNGKVEIEGVDGATVEV